MPARYDQLIDERRLTLYGRTFVVLYVVLAFAWLCLSQDGIDRLGKPLGYDFITFYAAAKLALQGHAADAFSVARLFAAEQAVVPANTMIFLWHYPPTFHLLVTPLGLVPYGIAYALFVGGTQLLYLALVRGIVGHPLAILLALAFPAAFINAFHGQNGFLNAAVLGFGLLALERRPVLAGVVLGLLAYKPHLGLLLPFLLAAGGHWRAFGAAALTVLAFCGVATAAFGLDYWHAFVANLSLTAEVLEEGRLPWPKMPSIFAFASLLGAPATLAYALQAALAVTAGAATVWAWRRPGPLDLKVALAVVATAMLSPYIFDYDLVLLAIPVAILARRSLEAGTSQNAALLVLVSLLPLFAPGLAGLHIQVMTLGLIALYIACWRSLGAQAGTVAPGRLSAAPAPRAA
jgi:hypothetical protein